MLLTLRGCSQRRKKESKRGVYLEKSRIKLKKVSKTIRTEEVVCLCVCSGSQCLYSGLVVSHKTQNQRGLQLFLVQDF